MEDPYKILGVKRDASPSQIKSAYRKLALKHHPDKQNSQADKHKAGPLFAKISNAYQVLSDENRRRQYDNKGAAPQHNVPFPGAAHFHDPFDVFAQAFEQELLGRRSRSSRSFSAMQDPFFDDPFFGHGMMGGFGGGSLFGGFGMMGNMNRRFDTMRQHQEDMMRRGGFGGGMAGSSGSFFSSSSSSNFGGGTSESVSTSTRIINGKRHTVTERTITHPDGRVERHVETNGDTDFPQEYLPPTSNGKPSKQIADAGHDSKRRKKSRKQDSS